LDQHASENDAWCLVTVTTQLGFYLDNATVSDKTDTKKYMLSDGDGV